MAPDNLKHIDPTAVHFLLGMVVRVKNFAELKGIAIVVTFIATCSFSVGIFYTQTNAMMVKQDEYVSQVKELTKIVIMLQRGQAISNNNIAHIRNDIDKFTVKLGQMESNIAKIRR